MSQLGPAVDIRKLTKRFGSESAVESIDLRVRRGATLGLLGPNGAGKSTTLRMLIGMLRPTSGSINVLNRDVLTESPMIRRHIGYVPDTNFAYRWMTIGGVIRFCRSMYDRWDDDLCTEFLDRFQLDPAKRVGSLSKGMLVKLSLLLALSHNPDLLVLDEPLSGLDPIARDDFIDGVMPGICSSTQTVLFSSHQLDEVSRLADDVAIMNRGRILVHGPLHDLLERFKRVRAILRDGCLPEAAPPGTIWQSVNRREWKLTVQGIDDAMIAQIQVENAVERIDVHSLSLEQLFRDFIRGDDVPDDMFPSKSRTEISAC